MSTQAPIASTVSRVQALVGKVIDGRYVLRDVIARGAMGAVFEAEQRPLNRPVALKLLDPAGPVDDPAVFIERFLREASTLARLKHPNTVRVYDYGMWGPRPYLVMEYVDGYSLKRLFAGGPVPPTRLVNIAVQMCGALYEAHSLGLIHRDLKPNNVLLTRHPGALDVVKVVDFGLAKAYYGLDSDLTQAGQVMGTPMYMAPEQIRDDHCDPRTDVYGLGGLLYRGLTGHTPFPKGKTMQVLMANLTEDPHSFSEVQPDLDVPPCLEWVIMRCLEKDPNKRFATMMELRKALKVCLRALEDPALYDLRIELEDGLSIVPDDFTDTSLTSMRAIRPGSGPHAAPTGSPTTIDHADLELLTPASAAVPRWATAALLMSAMAMGAAGGALAERVRTAVSDAAPTTPVTHASVLPTD